MPAQTQPGSVTESVTLEIDAQLLARAREADIDLASFLAQQLSHTLDTASHPNAVSHHDLVRLAFDDFEALMFAPLGIDGATELSAVRTRCQFVSEKVTKLEAYGQTRQTLGSPDSLSEIAALNQYLGQRYQALQTRMEASGDELEASGKVMEDACPELNARAHNMNELVQNSIGMYTPLGWCQAMQKKPKSNWTMQDSTAFIKFCTGG